MSEPSFAPHPDSACVRELARRLVPDRHAADLHPQRYVVWSVFALDTDYFGPGRLACMVNSCVDDLDRMLARLRAVGCDDVNRIQEEE